jgi:hypothetical protein
MCTGTFLACCLSACLLAAFQPRRTLSAPSHTVSIIVSVVHLLQFMLLELEDGTYAVILPLISQQKFRGTLRPPK